MELKCKMCGSDLYPEEGARTAICEVCGSEQTLPQADTPKKVNLFNKANHYRLQKRFDEAAKQYKKIIEDYPDDGEAYWCLLLCEYGIEYVDDKKTKTKIPTCNRTLKTPIFDQADYKKALKKASKEEKALYEKEAKEIDRLQKKILAISEKEEPYDIFICFRDTDEKGKRAKDSQYATLIYERLTERGYRVFFSRVTLKSKVGSEYELDYHKAVALYKRAAKVGNAKAQYNLGKCYESGTVLEKDYRKAVQYYRVAAEKGYAPAQNNLVSCYYYGKGVQRNRNEAVKWFEIAAKVGHELAIKNLRRIRQEEDLCPYCGGKFKGVFTKVCSNCGKKKDY